GQVVINIKQNNKDIRERVKVMKICSKNQENKGNNFSGSLKNHQNAYSVQSSTGNAFNPR
ncbi:MAG: hypothetical protein IJ143_05090, partial [Neisseriaceae bacterium]|nr:hypothetical protein [Neisseriaceae bacterium]